MLDTLKMKERLRQGGFSDEQADALVSVIRELSEVFVTKDFLRAELAKSERRVIGIVLTGVALMLALFAFVTGMI